MKLENKSGSWVRSESVEGGLVSAVVSMQVQGKLVTLQLTYIA